MNASDTIGFMVGLIGSESSRVFQRLFCSTPALLFQVHSVVGGPNSSLSRRLVFDHIVQPNIDLLVRLFQGFSFCLPDGFVFVDHGCEEALDYCFDLHDPVLQKL